MSQEKLSESTITTLFHNPAQSNAKEDGSYKCLRMFTGGNLIKGK